MPPIKIGHRKIYPHELLCESSPIMGWLSTLRQVQVYSMVYAYGRGARWGYMWIINSPFKSHTIYQEDVFGGDLDKLRLLGRTIFEGHASHSELVNYANDEAWVKIAEFLPSDPSGYDTPVKHTGDRIMRSSRLLSTYKQMGGV